MLIRLLGQWEHALPHGACASAVTLISFSSVPKYSVIFSTGQVEGVCTVREQFAQDYSVLLIYAVLVTVIRLRGKC